VSGATYDTGMLIALERRKSRALAIHERLFERAIQITVPWVVVVEFWRARSERRDAILRSVDIEAASIDLAKRSGEALAAAAGATIVDVVVMASAAARGDVVYTSDYDDLAALQRRFPNVRLLAV
jgi:predicted nucleic acid-binding protein